MSRPFLRKVYKSKESPPNWQKLIGLAVILLSMLLGALLKAHSIRSESSYVRNYQKAVQDAEAKRLNESVAPQTLSP